MPAPGNNQYMPAAKRMRGLQGPGITEVNTSPDPTAAQSNVNLPGVIHSQPAQAVIAKSKDIKETIDHFEQTTIIQQPANTPQIGYWTPGDEITFKINYDANLVGAGTGYAILPEMAKIKMEIIPKMDMAILNGLADQVFPVTLPSHEDGFSSFIDTVVVNRGTNDVTTLQDFYRLAGIKQAFLKRNNLADYLETSNLICQGYGNDETRRNIHSKFPAGAWHFKATESTRVTYFNQFLIGNGVTAHKECMYEANNDTGWSSTADMEGFEVKMTPDGTYANPAWGHGMTCEIPLYPFEDFITQKIMSFVKVSAEAQVPVTFTLKLAEATRALLVNYTNQATADTTYIVRNPRLVLPTYNTNIIPSIPRVREDKLFHDWRCFTFTMASGLTGTDLDFRFDISNSAIVAFLILFQPSSFNINSGYRLMNLANYTATSQRKYTNYKFPLPLLTEVIIDAGGKLIPFTGRKRATVNDMIDITTKSIGACNIGGINTNEIDMSVLRRGGVWYFPTNAKDPWDLQSVLPISTVNQHVVLNLRVPSGCTGWTSLSEQYTIFCYCELIRYVGGSVKEGYITTMPTGTSH
jgi:hypothetical protein